MHHRPHLSVLAHLLPHTPDILLSTLLINLLSLALPLALLQMYDRIIPNSAESTLMLLVLGVSSALLLDILVRLARSYVNGWIGARFEHTVGCAAMSTILGAKYNEFGRDETGNHLERMASIAMLKEFYSGQALPIALDLPFAIGYLWLIWFLGGWVVGIPLTMIALFGLSTVVNGQRLRQAVKDRATADDRRLNFIIEVLGGIHTVKSMAMEAQMVRRYERLQSTCADANALVATHSTAALDNAAFFMQITTIFLAAVGSLLVVNGEMTVGGLAASTMLAGRAMQPLQRAAGIWARFQSIRLARQRMHEIFAMSTEDDDNKPAFPPINGAIAMEGVSFRYAANAPWLLRDVTLSVAPGEMIGVSGDNASGKTTFLWLMQGALHPSEGTVRIDGADVTGFNSQSLREQIAYLPQHGVLFDGTIMENITMFRAELVGDALQIGEAMGLDHIVAHMPLGYETRVGDSATDSLPRGVNQRIAIARALVTRPRVLLFDEANTSMDAAGDALLRDMLVKTKGVRTVVLVTHRPSLLTLADRTFKLTNGTLLETTRRAA